MQDFSHLGASSWFYWRYVWFSGDYYQGTNIWQNREFPCLLLILRDEHTTTKVIHLIPKALAKELLIKILLWKSPEKDNFEPKVCQK